MSTEQIIKNYQNIINCNNKKTRLIDFDGVLFNSNNNYTLNFLRENLYNPSLVTKINPNNFYDGSINILLTGRSKVESGMIMNMLYRFGYVFVQYIFSNFNQSDYQSINFISKYIDWKIGEIANFKSIENTVVIDDDKRIIDLSKQLGYKIMYIEKFQKELILW